MTEMQAFGNPNRFEISARWIQDGEPRDRLPKAYGWSMGEFCIKVAGVTLTEHRLHGKPQEAIQWYLGPLVSWLLSQWKWLMHEEAYPWSALSGDSAAFTVEADLERYMASEYPKDADVYKTIRAWWMRHALRSADPSALFPPIYIRRVEDSIEVSWLDKQPEFAPDGFALNLNPGAVLLPVEEVAKPLWEFLRWAIATAQPETDDDKAQAETLRSRFHSTQRFDEAELQAAHVTAEILKVIREEGKGWRPDAKMSDGVPVVTAFDSRVLMFGGLRVNVGSSDVRNLFNILIEQRGGQDGEQLIPLVSSPLIYAYLKPYAQGYELAYQTREALGIDVSTAFVDIEKYLKKIGIAVLDTALETNSIRGVAIAGEDFTPTIVVNSKHRFNASARGRRFTLAHEFCHILFDRSHAKRLSHISGTWTSDRVEKRANAFAALFLATPHALEGAVNAKNLDTGMLKNLAERFGIGTGALLEHLHNLDLISENDFQALRYQSQPPEDTEHPGLLQQALAMVLDRGLKASFSTTSAPPFDDNEASKADGQGLNYTASSPSFNLDLETLKMPCETKTFLIKNPRGGIQPTCLQKIKELVAKLPVEIEVRINNDLWQGAVINDDGSVDRLNRHFKDSQAFQTAFGRAFREDQKLSWQGGAVINTDGSVCFRGVRFPHPSALRHMYIGSSLPTYKYFRFKGQTKTLHDRGVAP